MQTRKPERRHCSQPKPVPSSSKIQPVVPLLTTRMEGSSSASSDWLKTMFGEKSGGGTREEMRRRKRGARYKKPLTTTTTQQTMTAICEEGRDELP
eukprot:505829-Hanusia_phi.AAC.1